MQRHVILEYVIYIPTDTVLGANVLWQERFECKQEHARLLARHWYPRGRAASLQWSRPPAPALRAWNRHQAMDLVAARRRATEGTTRTVNALLDRVFHAKVLRPIFTSHLTP